MHAATSKVENSAQVSSCQLKFVHGCSISDKAKKVSATLVQDHEENRSTNVSKIGPVHVSMQPHRRRRRRGFHLFRRRSHADSAPRRRPGVNVIKLFLSSPLMTRPNKLEGCPFKPFPVRSLNYGQGQSQPK